MWFAFMRYAVRAEVGAVGAKLLYEDSGSNSAGVVAGIGGAAVDTLIVICVLSSPVTSVCLTWRTS